MTSDNIKKEPDTVEDTPQVRFGSSVKFSVVFFIMFQGKGHTLLWVFRITLLWAGS